MDRVKLAGLFTFFTADTPGGTGVSGVFSGVAVKAFYHDLLRFLVDPNDPLGAYVGAHSAANAKRLVDMRPSVYNADRTILANVHTIAESQTAVITLSLSAIIQVAGTARIDPVIFKNIFCRFARAFAVYLCHQSFHCFKANTKDLTDRAGGLFSARQAKVCF